MKEKTWVKRRRMRKGGTKLALSVLSSSVRRCMICAQCWFRAGGMPPAPGTPGEAGVGGPGVPRSLCFSADGTRGCRPMVALDVRGVCSTREGSTPGKSARSCHLKCQGRLLCGSQSQELPIEMPGQASLRHLPPRAPGHALYRYQATRHEQLVPLPARPPSLFPSLPSLHLR